MAVLTKAEESSRQQIVQLIRDWGGSSSDAILDPTIDYFFEPSIPGLIAYRSEPGCLVVFGDPICPPAYVSSLSEAFHQYSKNQKQAVIYLTVSEKFRKWALNTICAASIEFGEELILDPQNDPQKMHGAHASLVRRKVRHAMREGVHVYEYTNDDPFLERSMEELKALWLASRKGPQIHISNVYLFNDTVGKRWFYATHKDTIVGVLVLNELKRSQGWLFNHLMALDNAPGGTPEILVTTALDKVRAEGCRYVNFGCVANPHLRTVTGMGLLTTITSRVAYRFISAIFKMSGSQKFWEKFHPQRERSFILFSNPHIGMQEIKALKKALNTTF